MFVEKGLHMIRTRFAAVSFAIGAGFVLFGAASASAFTVDWSSAGYTYVNLGWQDSVSNPNQYDILQGLGNSGTNLDLGAGPVTVIDPATNTQYVLVRADVFEELQEWMRDLEPQDAYPVVDRVMAGDDAHDPTLASYQDDVLSRKPA